MDTAGRLASWIREWRFDDGATGSATRALDMEDAIRDGEVADEDKSRADGG